MFERSLDQQGDFILVTAIGEWQRDDIDDHYAELSRMVEERRASGLPVRVLIDMTRSARQHPDIEAYVKSKVATIYRGGDRIATIVVADDKSYMRATLGAVDVATFSSRLPAEMWLMEPTLRRPD